MRNVALDEITRLHAEVDRLTAFAQEASRLYKAQKVRADKVEAVSDAKAALAAAKAAHRPSRKKKKEGGW